MKTEEDNGPDCHITIIFDKKWAALVAINVQPEHHIHIVLRDHHVISTVGAFDLSFIAGKSFLVETDTFHVAKTLFFLNNNRSQSGKSWYECKYSFD